MHRNYGFRRPKVDYTSNARTATALHIEHALEITSFMVALALACSRHGRLEVMYFDEIMRELVPAETRRWRDPYSWPVLVRPVPGKWQGRVEKPLYVRPDLTFAIRYLDLPEGQNRKFFFHEGDRATMPVVRPDLTKSSLLRKLVLYGLTHVNKLHQRYYGLPHFRVLTLVPTRERVGTIVAAYHQHTKHLFRQASVCLPIGAVSSPPRIFLHTHGLMPRVAGIVCWIECPQL